MSSLCRQNKTGCVNTIFESHFYVELGLYIFTFLTLFNVLKYINFLRMRGKHTNIRRRKSTNRNAREWVKEEGALLHRKNIFSSEFSFYAITNYSTFSYSGRAIFCKSYFRFPTTNVFLLKGFAIKIIVFEV